MILKMIDDFPQPELPSKHNLIFLPIYLIINTYQIIYSLLHNEKTKTFILSTEPFRTTGVKN